MKRFRIVSILLATVVLMGLMTGNGHGQLWREFTHTTNPHPGLTVPQLAQATGDITVTRPLLVVLMEFSDTTAQALHSAAFWRDLVFGPAPGANGTYVTETFRESSNNRFVVVPATAGDVFDGNADGVVGWVKSSQSYFVLTSPEKKRAEAIRVADPLFNYAIYDTNNDGLITSDELLILPVFGDQSGNNCCDQHPGHPWLPGCIGCSGGNARVTDPPQVVVEAGTPQQKRVSHGLVGAVGEMAEVGTAAHELAHPALGHGDLYIQDCTQGTNGWICPDGWYPPGPEHYSLMDEYHNSYVTHLEPWGKIHLGFVRPHVVTHDGTYVLHDVETRRQFSVQNTQPEALIIYDPLRSDPYREYFILENRNLAAGPDQGLAVWLIDEHSLSWPDKLNWRRTDRLIRRAGYHEDLDNNALWNGVDDIQGYDLSATSTPRNTNWADGSRSYIEIYDVSAAGPVMTFKVRMPPIFADRGYTGPETGSQTMPFNTVSEAVAAIPESPRSIKIAGGSYPGAMTITTPVTFLGWRNGSAVIGK